MIRLFVLILVLTGCSHLATTPILDKNIHYQRDMVMKIQYAKDGVWQNPLTITGVGVMPKSTWYRVKVFPPAKSDMMTLTSCHREIKTPNPKKSGGWFKEGYYEFEINASNSVDSDLNCSFTVGSYNKEHGQHAWGFFAMEDPFYTMGALTKCNGRVKKYDGVSACQAKAGAIQEYVFNKPVAPAEVKGCEIVDTMSGKKYTKRWRFPMPLGPCEVEFYDIDDPLRSIHKASLFGYSKIPIRGVEP